MGKRLGTIEILDQQLPGLADQLRQWLTQGVPCRQIVDLLFERYQIRLSPSPIERFRTRRWAPEQKRLGEKMIAAHVEQELEREREISSAMDRILGELK